MRLPVVSASRYPVEFALLLGLAFFLPLFEAPKNLLWLAWIAVWLVNRSRQGEWGGGWDKWDTLIAGWIASAIVVAAFSGIKHQEWRGAFDVVRYGCVVWLVRRGGYSKEELGWLAAMLLASCSVGLAWGFWKFVAVGPRAMQLHSVGHSNHSAPYIAIAAGFALSVTVFAWAALGRGMRVLAIVATALCTAGLLATTSRSAVAAMLLVPVVLAAGIWTRSRRQGYTMLGLLCAAVVAAVALNIDVVRKHQKFATSADPTNGRQSIWRRAVVAWEIYPVFGVGIDNYGKIPEDAVRKRVEQRGDVYRRDDYLGPNHAHSLYLNTLAERGTFGIGVLLTVLVAWAATLWRDRPRMQAGPVETAYWGGAATAWTVTVVAGIGNTSFHHEIAILAMFLLGGWLALRRSGP